MADYSQNRVLPLYTSDAANKIAMPLVWPKNRGANKIIAVLSTGVGNHPDIDSQILDGKNFTADNSGDPLNYYDGDTGLSKGTTMASTIGAINKQDGTDMYSTFRRMATGFASETKLIIGKMLKNSDGYTTASNSSVADAIKWATDWVGTNGETTDIIVVDYYQTADSPLIKAACDYAETAGKFVIANSGFSSNSTNTNPFYPANYSNVISVSVDDGFDGKRNNYDYNSQVNFIVPHENTAIKYNSNSTQWEWSNSFGNHINGAIGAAALAIILSAYEEAGTPITTMEQLLVELPKYCRTGRPDTISAFGAGILDFGASKLPNDVGDGETIIEYVEVPGETVYVDVPGETVYVDREVIVEVPGETVTEYVDREVIVEVEVPGPVEYVDREIIKYIYTGDGSGGSSLSYGVENNVVKADYGRNAVLAKRIFKQ